MPKRYVQSQADLETHLNHVVEGMEASVRSFDEGRIGEAARLALAIRVLVHDTQKSKSLLGQLGRKTMPFYDTASEVLPGNVLTYNGITGILQTTEGAKYCALLDMLPPGRPGRYVDFDAWWTKVIFVDNRRRQITRQNLILEMANTDGGAHVDPKLDDTYAALARENALAWVFVGPKGELPVEGPELAAVRQIAHEALRSLNPSLPELKPALPRGAVLSADAIATVTRARTAKVGRNDPCPCGSGKKYKRCCLR